MSLLEVEELKHLIECPSPIPLKDLKDFHEKNLEFLILFCTTKTLTHNRPEYWAVGLSRKRQDL
jgi:hypothetical protein